MVATSGWTDKTYCPSNSLLRFDKSDLDRSAHEDTRALPPVSKKKRQRRTVRFSFVEDVQTFDRDSSLSTSDLYWSAEDRAGFSRRARQDCAVSRGSQKEQIKKIEAICGRCGDSPVSKVQQCNDLQVMLAWAESNGRGLERGVSSVFRCKQHDSVKQIVKLHRNLMSLVPKNGAAGGIGVAATALAAYSRRKTSAARDFAYKLGVSDAACVSRK